MERQHDAATAQFAERHDRQQHAERAVEFSGIAHRVEVRAEQKGLGFFVRRGESPDQISRGILAHAEPRFAHPRPDEFVCPAHGRRQERPRQRAALVGHLSELGEFADELVRGAGHADQLPR